MGNLQTILNDKADAVLSACGVPNIAAVIVRDQGRTTLHSARGIRDTTQSASAASNHVDKTDYFNVGSVSKPISGFLLACLIKKGVLSWNTTIGSVFPEFRAQAFRDRCGMNETFLGTKVFELMAHTSAMDGRYYYALNDDSKNAQHDTDPFRFIADQGIIYGNNSRDPEWKHYEAVVYQRYLYTVLCLKKEKYVFGASRNLGYQNTATSGYGSTSTICAAMIDRLTGKPFESAMKDLLAAPLQMDIKYGHLPHGMQYHKYDDAEGKFLPVAAYNSDFAPYVSKFVTGGIHCTVAGMAQYIRYNLRAIDYSNIFDVAAYQAPVTDAAQGGLYLGGGTNHEPLNHRGETDASLARLAIYPHTGYGLCVMLNANGGPEANTASVKQAAKKAQDDMFDELVDMHQDWNNL